MPRTTDNPSWEKPGDMPEALWRILFARGCDSYEAARAFLGPSEKDILDPGELSDMAISVETIKKAVRDGRRICVWGDYDVDGVSAVAILLKTLKRLGADVFHHIPSRSEEGYGFNEKGVMELDCGLLISADCGVSEREIIDKALKKGVSVIVTDHHEPPAELPDCPVINPKLGEYKNRDLCGAGVAYKLALALCPESHELIDIAALATVADVVPLRGENRAIVKLGLERANERPRTGIAALARAAGLTGEINSQAVAFQISPRLNATGRVESAEKALRLIMSEDEAECETLAQELNSLNQKRRELEQEVLRGCDKALEDYDLSRAHGIILAGEGWPGGVVGLAASRLAEKYNMPAILLSKDGGIMTGSCRSIPGCDIHEALTRVSGLLTRFGGHSQAAGLTLESVNFAAFKDALDAAIAEITPEEAFIPRVEYDCEEKLREITPEFISSLAALEPTGFGNPSPAFLSRFAVENARRMGKDGAHASFTAVDQTGSLRGVWFSRGEQIESFAGNVAKAVYSPYINEFRGEASAQLRVKRMLAERERALFIDPESEAELVNSFITQTLYNTPIARKCESLDFWKFRGILASKRGCIVVACDSAIAGTVADMPEFADADVYVGRYPTDPLCYNAVCLLPAGEIPKGYETVIAAGCPGWLVSETAYEFALAGVAKWLGEMPDVDELREIYKACRAFARTPASIPGGMYLSRVLADMAGASPVKVAAGLMVLRDMGLIDYGLAPARLEICPFAKVDPKKNESFRAISEIKRWGGARA